LIICTGNICRSPSAEGVLRQHLETAGLAESVRLDSAGTGGWHVGDPPSRRAVVAAAERGYDLSALKARQFRIRDFSEFEVIFGMDEGHMDFLVRSRPGTSASRLHRFMDFADRNQGIEVPDPYYGDERDYAYALDLIEEGAEGIVRALRDGNL
jgi:protein-tyrosine phosphatase